MKPTWESDCGTVKLWLGDCLEVMQTWPDGAVDAVVTDPPYGIGFERKTNDYRGSAFFDGGKTAVENRYCDEEQHVTHLVTRAMQISWRISDRGLWFGGQEALWRYPTPNSWGGVFLPNGAGRLSWGFKVFHPILFYGDCPYLSSGRGARPTGFRTEQPNKDRSIDHPCPKPLPWMVWAVERASLEDQAIADPFMGSGTTGVAAVRLGRQFWGVEIDPGYFEIAKKRIQDELVRFAFLEPQQVKQATLFDEVEQ